VLRGEQTIASCGDLLLNRLIAVCNGEQTKAEQLGFSEISVYHSNEVWCCDL
jgi:altronate dehydratase large subunit